MANYLHVIFFSLIGGVFSLLGAVLFLRSKNAAEKLAKYATPFAAGALLAAVFLDLLKEGLEQTSVDTVMISALAGIVIFFFAERFLHWFHHHHQHENSDPSKALIITGDTLHNALDGVAIAAAFLISVPTGIVTTIAVAAHEIPQEIGDFGLLLSKGMSRKKVLWVNALSALATTVAAVVTFAAGSQDKLPVGVLFGLSAGFLLYIALSDVIPEIHENASHKRLLDWQPILFLLGIVVVAVSISISHRYVEAGHTEHSESCSSYYDKEGKEVHFEDCPEPGHADEGDEDHKTIGPEPGKVCIQIYPPPPGCETPGQEAKIEKVREACNRAAKNPSGPEAGISADEAICNGSLAP